MEKEGEGFVQSMRELGKDFCPNSTQNALESIDRRRRNDGSREYLVGVPPKAASSGSLTTEFKAVERGLNYDYLLGFVSLSMKCGIWLQPFKNIVVGGPSYTY